MSRQALLPRPALGAVLCLLLVAAPGHSSGTAVNGAGGALSLFRASFEITISN